MEQKKNIYCNFLHAVQEAKNQGETNYSSIDNYIVLPSSFTGGMRYMFNSCQDPMVICKKIGYPNLFIIITCNVNYCEFL